jgi:hypothetical protein
MDPRDIHRGSTPSTFTSRDHKKSVRFYLEKLGFQIAFDARLQSGQRLIAVAPPHGSAVLTLD